jgi:hypothetical protein
VLTETVVSIDDGKAAGVPTDLSVCGMPVPKGLGNEKVVIFEFSSEGAWWNVEESVTSVEVVKIPGDLVASNLPSGMLSISVERMLHISPCVIESLD